MTYIFNMINQIIIIQPISAINTVNIAKGVPYPTEDRRPVREIEDNYNKNRFNQEQSNNYLKVLYKSPSVASSTVAFKAGAFLHQYTNIMKL